MKPVKIFIIIFVFLISFGAYCLWADKALTSRSFEITDKSIPAAFDGFRVVHISDLHNALFGKENEKLLEKIKAEEPDIIAVTGDIIDSRRTDTAVAIDFIEKALKIADVYYVTGNHEYRSPQGKELVEDIERLGATVLKNESLELKKGGSKITICGIEDPYFYGGYMSDEEEYVTAYTLDGIEKTKNFTLLLSHRPEFFNLYCEYGFDLVLSGHAHGGQVRLPFVGGVVAPNQGFFPE